MQRLTKRMAMAAVLCWFGAGCAESDGGEIGAISGPFFPEFGCSSNCDAVALTPDGTILLLGDTMTLSASTGADNTDFSWSQSGSALQLGSPSITSSYYGHSSTVVAVGKKEGVSTVTATRKSKSASVSVEVIPPASLRTVEVKRSCLYTQIGSCAGLSLGPDQKFRDSLAVGDTALLQVTVRDNANRVIKATLTLSTGDSTIAGITYKQWYGFVIGAKSPGAVAITARAGTIESPFILYVYKR